MNLRREYGGFSLDFDSESIKDGHLLLAIQKGLSKDDFIGAIVRLSGLDEMDTCEAVAATMASPDGGAVTLHLLYSNKSLYYNPETGLVSDSVDSVFTYDAITIENGVISPMHLKPGMSDANLLSIPVTMNGETVSVVKSTASRDDAITVKKNEGALLFTYYVSSGKLELLRDASDSGSGSGSGTAGK